MGDIKVSKNVLAMFIFMLLFSFADLIVYINTSNKIGILAIVMILLPCSYMIYQIKSNNEKLPKYIRFIGIISALLYLFYEILNLVIYFFSFYIEEDRSNLIWENKIIIFFIIMIIIYILNRINFDSKYFERAVFWIFVANIILLFNLVILILKDNSLVTLMNFNSNYTNLIVVFIPILFLSFLSVSNNVLKKSLFLSIASYIVIVLVIMFTSVIILSNNDILSFFKDFSNPTTISLLFGKVLILVILILEILKACIIYIIAKDYYDLSSASEFSQSFLINGISLIFICLLIILFSNNLWTMLAIIQTMYITFSILFLVILSWYCLYLCFKKYIVPSTKVMLLILSTFPIIACLVYLEYIDSPLFNASIEFIRGMDLMFFIFSVLVLMFYITETLILWFGYRKRINCYSIEDDAVEEEIYIIVMIPCMNEELVINKTVNSVLNNDFKNLSVYIIDDDSSDNTLSEVNKCFDKRKRVLKRKKPNAQLGKGEALNWAYYQIIDEINNKGLNSNNVLITIIDADTEVECDYFHKVSKVFKTKKAITGLQSKVRVIDLGNDSAQDLEFAQITNSMQALRNLTKTVAFGGNGQFCRLSILEKLGEKPWSDSLVEDFDLSTRLYLALGNQINNIQFDDIYIKQSGIVNDSASLVKQRVRWAQGNVQSFKYVKKIIASPKLRLVQKIELCTTLIKPWLMAIEYAILTYTIVIIVDVYMVEGITNVLVLIIVLFLIMGCFIIFINLIWAILYNKDKECKFSVLKVFSDTYYLTRFLFTLTQIYPQSILRELKSDNGWDKTNRYKSK